MPQLFSYHLFISHAWKYGGEYNRLTNMLDNALYFNYCNYSAPHEKLLKNLDSTDVTTKNEIKFAIIRKIERASCVLVISGMYYNYREWMQYEIDVAKYLKKPVIAIVPWGNHAIPREVMNAADEIVGWNTSSIVSAIRKHCR